MKLLDQVTSVKNNHPNIAVALGTFDGLHIGHQQVIGSAVKWATHHKGTSVVFTFSNHPLSIVAPQACPLLIYSNKTKSRIIDEMGVDILFNIPFTTELLQLPPDDFIRLLFDNLKPRHIIVGPNYSFGFKGLGTPEMLQRTGDQLGFTVDIHPAVIKNGMIVSSTSIRQYLAAGNVRDASALLGRQYTLYDMEVIPGERRGRQLGYPTANLAILPGLIVPADGVYAVKILHGNQYHIGVANIGTNPTFNDHTRRIEVHILNFSQNIYRNSIDVVFYHRLRGERRFDSAELLKKQIFLDVEHTQNYFSSKNDCFC